MKKSLTSKQIKDRQFVKGYLSGLKERPSGGGLCNPHQAELINKVGIVTVNGIKYKLIAKESSCQGIFYLKTVIYG